KSQKVLILFAVLWLAAAEYLRFVPMSRHRSIILGLAEVCLAVATGAIFGITVVRRLSSR
ncbi:MAG TPA: hypothetical protein VEZ90_08075, partial [Blastocatellia bacterium]|nr:hypothetical protein [Blastocatellia bacterium]